MLVLHRGINQDIIIGDDIVIRVVEFHGRGGKVRLGITAPEGVRIDREEVHRRRVAERTAEKGGAAP